MASGPDSTALSYTIVIGIVFIYHCMKATAYSFTFLPITNKNHLISFRSIDSFLICEIKGSQLSQLLPSPLAVTEGSSRGPVDMQH